MELWGWLIGYVVLFALLHLALYYYYVRRESGDRSSTPTLTDGNFTGTRYASRPDRYSRTREDSDPDRHDSDRRHDDSHGPADQTDREFDDEPVECPHCGALNAADQTYTFCWNCISALRR